MEARQQEVIPPANAFKWAWFGVYLIASLFVLYIFTHYLGMNRSNHGTLNSMVDFWGGNIRGDSATPSGSKSSLDVVWRPFSGRMLVPWLIGALEKATPQLVQDTLWQTFSKSQFHPEFNPWDYRLFLFELIALPCFLFAGYMARKSYALAYNAGPVESSVAGLFFLLGIPLWYRYFLYPYDPATIALGAGMAYAILARKHAFFAILFALACLNKETAILALPVWVFATWISGHRRLALLGLVTMGAFWVAVRLYIRAATQHLPGT
ncbi:MAG: hypothetical protein QOJ65_2052, partial [Fimbriimonadaceae bacterium]|nr:hypothetical protein [Fimbriimonadaceae bacterium]